MRLLQSYTLPTDALRSFIQSCTLPTDPLRPLLLRLEIFFWLYHTYSLLRGVSIMPPRVLASGPKPCGGKYQIEHLFLPTYCTWTDDESHILAKKHPKVRTLCKAIKQNGYDKNMCLWYLYIRFPIPPVLENKFK